MNVGTMGEQIAAEHYQKLGFKIILKNLRVHLQKQVSEIDLVAVNEHSTPKEIVFVEVKTRINVYFGMPAESVNFSKKQKLLRAVQLFLIQRPQYDSYQPRIDVAEVRLPNIDNAKGVDKSRASVIILANVIEDY